MDLDDYIKLNYGGNQAAFARVANVDKATVSRVCNKATRPSRKTVSKISKATNGKVKWSDMLAPSEINE